MMKPSLRFQTAPGCRMAAPASQQSPLRWAVRPGPLTRRRTARSAHRAFGSCVVRNGRPAAGGWCHGGGG